MFDDLQIVRAKVIFTPYRRPRPTSGEMRAAYVGVEPGKLLKGLRLNQPHAEENDNLIFNGPIMFGLVNIKYCCLPALGLGRPRPVGSV